MTGRMTSRAHDEQRGGRWSGRLTVAGAAALAAGTAVLAPAAAAGASTPSGSSATVMAWRCSLAGAEGDARPVFVIAAMDGGAPAQVGTGEPLTLHPTMQLGAAPAPPGVGWFGVAVTVTGVHLGITATGASPAFSSTTATNVPVPVKLFSHPTIQLAPVTLTAGSPGTATASVGSMTIDVQESFFGFFVRTATLQCTPLPSNPPLATIPVAATSAVSVESDGAGVLALVVAIGGMGMVAGRRFRRRVASTRT